MSTDLSIKIYHNNRLKHIPCPHDIMFMNYMSNKQYNIIYKDLYQKPLDLLYKSSEILSLYNDYIKKGNNPNYFHLFTFKDYSNWIQERKPYVYAGYISMYNNFLYKNKGIIPKYIYKQKKNDYIFTTIQDQNHPSLIILNYIYNIIQNPKDTDIIINYIK